MIRLIYNVLFWIFFIVTAPYYFLRLWKRGNWQKNFGQRFGFYSNDLREKLRGKKNVWFHAVSVGEVNIVVELIKKFRAEHSDFNIVATATTTTGMAELQGKLGDSISSFYYPIDWGYAVHKALNLVKPQAIILIEAEIWPNFLWEATRRNIPLYLMNARLSDRSYARYKKALFLFEKIFSSFTAIGVQNTIDREHLIALGADPKCVHITGNLKFDGASNKLDNKLNIPLLLSKIGVNDDAQIIVAGSTHAGEELMLAKICKRLSKQFPKLFLILVPRHFERCKDVVSELKVADIHCALRSEIKDTTHSSNVNYDCLLVNTTGELRYFYGVAQIVFVGKSILAKGGQNPIEPAALGKAVITGMNMQNFTSVMRSFRRQNAIIQVTDEQELEKVFIDLLKHPEECNELGNRALDVVKSNQGGIELSCKVLQGIQ